MLEEHPVFSIPQGNFVRQNIELLNLVFFIFEVFKSVELKSA